MSDWKGIASICKKIQIKCTVTTLHFAKGGEFILALYEVKMVVSLNSGLEATVSISACLVCQTEKHAGKPVTGYCVKRRDEACVGAQFDATTVPLIFSSG